MGWFSGLWTTISGSSSIVEKGVDLVDDVISTSEERTEADQADLKDARTSQDTSTAGKGNIFDSVVDGTSRLIRPVCTLWLMGGFMGLFEFPATDKIDPFYQNLFWLIMTFWFGGRAIMKDIPSFIKAIRK